MRWIIVVCCVFILLIVSSSTKKRAMNWFIMMCCTLGAFAVFAGTPASFAIHYSDILYVYDGDTFYITCRAGLRCQGGKLGIRPPGIDAPEIKGKCTSERDRAQRSKQFADELLRSANQIVLIPNPGRPYDKYGRLLARVELDGQNFGQMMMDAGLARAYGGGRRPWCGL